MANTARILAALTATLTAAVVGPRPALAQATPGSVVFHVTDYANVSTDYLTDAQKIATRVFEAAGIPTTWQKGPAPSAVADGALHLDVIILSAAMTERKCKADGVPEGVLGQAARSARRAVIFLHRIRDFAQAHSANATSLFGLVLAHEAGHLLLPEHSHSKTGIMRAQWDRSVTDGPLIQTFTETQAHVIRMRLSAN